MTHLSKTGQEIGSDTSELGRFIRSGLGWSVFFLVKLGEVELDQMIVGLLIGFD